ncbi:MULTISPECIES: quinone oxidoreductase [Devosia]|uniref:Quinone oxidoreductase 1 n=1 Tax=Devosia equisanguinis TaxID=2490941 RepID=A0A447IFV2_9HYPH|nr:MULTISPECIES: quinone oxidoreductase [Devosia]ODT50304.1 MAG: quinone oxidoreductase [Pelagibacterium sp. SCN 63-126]ODU83506.1 MAG: quinone oxidoreductase [Pelagibacterium sp. SCN 63-17]OJX45048.1 MAG: quinone oxidoreductase [Devosia sp. 63-57]VDS06361.1 Quinone oxidoreductase 1 [Devosia equisanguinis]
MTKAIVVRETGGPEVLSLEDWDVAAPGPGQVRLRQTAIGLNFIDTYQRSGLYPLPMPFVAGNEGAGIVDAVGEGVSEFRPGDRVAYQGVPGAYASERLIAAEKLVPLPDGVDEQTAAAVMLKGLTAYYLLFKTWAVQRGETILWHAAAGGTGLIATQWAKALGATVIGTVGSSEKADMARAHGCDHVINYRQEDFAARVRDLTGGRGVDVVYDGVGKATFEGSLDSLRPRGLLASFGNASGPVSVPDLGILARKGSLFVTRPTGVHYYARREDLLEGAAALFDAIKSGAIKVEISRRFALSDAADAHRALEGRETSGSVVLLP